MPDPPEGSDWNDPGYGVYMTADGSGHDWSANDWSEQQQTLSSTPGQPLAVRSRPGQPMAGLSSSRPGLQMTLLMTKLGISSLLKRCLLP